MALTIEERSRVKVQGWIPCPRKSKSEPLAWEAVDEADPSAESWSVYWQGISSSPVRLPTREAAHALRTTLLAAYSQGQQDLRTAFFALFPSPPTPTSETHHK